MEFFPMTLLQFDFFSYAGPTVAPAAVGGRHTFGDDIVTELLATILDTVAEGVIYQEASGNILLMNRGAEKLFRLTTGEAIGQTSLSREWNLIYEDGEPCPGNQHPSMITLATGRPLEDQVRGLEWKDGSVTWLSINTRPIFESDGEKPSAVVITFTDFTQRMMAENALITGNERYQSFIEHTEEAIFRTEFREPVDVSLGLDEQIEAIQDNAYIGECNPAMAKLYGLESVEQMIGRKRAEFCESDNPVNRKALREFIESGYRKSGSETEITDPAGEKKYIVSNSSGVVENGRLVRVWGTSRDQSRQKQAENAARQSEARLKIALEAASAGIWEWDAEGGDRVRGKDFSRLHDHRSGTLDASHRTWLRSVIEADRPRVEAAIQEAEAGRTKFKVEWRTRATDGSIRWIMATGRPQYREGKLSKYVGVAIDVTELKLAREALSESKLFLDNISDLAYLTDMRGNLLWANPAAEKFIDRSLAEIIGQPIGPMLSDFDRRALAKIYRRVLRGESLKGVVTFKSGVACDYTALPKYDDQGNIVGVFGVARDISDSLAQEKALRESEDKFATAFKLAPMLMTISDLETGTLIEANDAWCSASGHTRREALGRTSVDLGWITPEGRNEARAKLEAQGRIRNMELEVRSKSGQTVHVVLSAELVSLAGRPVILVGALDITERKKIEQRLRENDEIFRRTFHTSPDSININRLRDGLYININDGFTRLTGFTREDVTGRTSADIEIWNDPSDRQKLVAGLTAHGFVENLEAQFKRKDGSLTTALMSASVIQLNGEAHIVSVTRDISELKAAQEEKDRLEAQLNQAQKMEALGTLAGGIAHDFNNILASIIGYSELALDELAADSSASDKIRQVIRSGGRAKDLVTQILAFSRKLKPELKPINLNRIVGQTEAMLARAIPKMVNITLRLEKNPWLVKADSGQMVQLVMNLGANASDAMPDGGSLIIETANLNPDISFRAGQADSRNEKFVRLTVSDNGLRHGPGDPEAHLRPLLHP